jgi:hypothetical protein
MPALRVSVSADDLRTRVRLRLLNGAPAGTPAVVWTAADADVVVAEVVVHVASVELRLTDGWLLVDVPLETSETGRVDVRCLYFLGRADRGDGLKASAVIDPRAPQLLVGRWGDALLTAVWSGVQDVLEGAYQAVVAAFPKDTPTLAGYVADEGAMRVAISR